MGNAVRKCFKGDAGDDEKTEPLVTATGDETTSNFEEHAEVEVDRKDAFFDEGRKTLRPRQAHATSKRRTLHRTFRASFGKGIDLRELVKLPEGVELNEWIAVMIVDVYNELTLLYTLCHDACSPLHPGCDAMRAGPHFSFLWPTKDGNKSYPAREYLCLLFDFLAENIRSKFPTEEGQPFPDDFDGVAKVMLKRMFRVYAHLYHSHFPLLLELKAVGHINLSFKRFLYFVQGFDLVASRDLAPLAPLVARFSK